MIGLHELPPVAAVQRGWYERVLKLQLALRLQNPRIACGGHLAEVAGRLGSRAIPHRFQTDGAELGVVECVVRLGAELANAPASALSQRWPGTFHGCRGEGRFHG